MATTILTMSGEAHSGGQQRPGKKFPKLGDLSWFSDNITAINRNGVDIPPGNAHESGFCIYVRETSAPGGARWLCQGGFELPGGQIHSRGLMDFSGPGPVYELHAAILGGTNLYNRAMGQIDVKWKSDDDPTTTKYVMTIEQT